jgi:hypothetical protein
MPGLSKVRRGCGPNKKSSWIPSAPTNGVTYLVFLHLYIPNVENPKNVRYCLYWIFQDFLQVMCNVTNQFAPGKNTEILSERNYFVLPSSTVRFKITYKCTSRTSSELLSDLIWCRVSLNIGCSAMGRQVSDVGKCFRYSVRMLAAVCRKGGNKTL